MQKTAYAPCFLAFLLLLLIGCDASSGVMKEPDPDPDPNPDSVATEPIALKVATWNIEHLRAENNTGNVRRTQADYDRLAGYATELDADVVALQEVDGPEAAARVFDPDTYNFYFSARNNVLRTGFAVRKGITVFQQPDYTALDVTGGLRYGTDIAILQNNRFIRLMSVHLKSGCFDLAMRTNNDACQKLNRQLPILEAWIDARAEAETPFAVLGDFNRRFDAANDTFWPEIDDADPANADLSRPTEGQVSRCLEGRFPLYIDHIALDLQSTGWMAAGTFGQLTFREPASQSDKLSDHCPIFVTIDVPPAEAE